MIIEWLFRYTSKDDAISIMKNYNLSEKSELLWIFYCIKDDW